MDSSFQGMVLLIWMLLSVTLGNFAISKSRSRAWEVLNSNLDSNYGMYFAPILWLLARRKNRVPRRCLVEPSQYGRFEACRHRGADCDASPRDCPVEDEQVQPPLARLRWKKNRTGARLNYPLFYLRRIKRNPTGVGRRRRTTTVVESHAAL